MGETRFGHYRLDRLLGSGGTGQVWLARDTVADRDVALKVLAATHAADPTYRLRFTREARLAAHAPGPHMVPIHNFGELDGRLYIDMEFIEGTDVAALLRRDGPMSPARAVAIIGQTAMALDTAHRAGLVHRDVKPSNIMVTPCGFVRLIDFGIAQRIDQPAITSHGNVVGTLAYMAPERFSGIADARADQYSLACVLYECLTGQRPFGTIDSPQQFHAHLLVDPPRAAALNPAVALALDAAIARAMAKNPAERWSSAGEFASAAYAAVTGREASTVEIAARTVPITRPLPDGWLVGAQDADGVASLDGAEFGSRCESGVESLGAAEPETRCAGGVASLGGVAMESRGSDAMEAAAAVGTRAVPVSESRWAGGGEWLGRAAVESRYSGAAQGASAAGAQGAGGVGAPGGDAVGSRGAGVVESSGLGAAGLLGVPVSESRWAVGSPGAAAAGSPGASVAGAQGTAQVGSPGAAAVGAWGERPAELLGVPVSESRWAVGSPGAAQVGSPGAAAVGAWGAGAAESPRVAAVGSRDGGVVESRVLGAVEAPGGAAVEAWSAGVAGARGVVAVGSGGVGPVGFRGVGAAGALGVGGGESPKAAVGERGSGAVGARGVVEWGGVGVGDVGARKRGGGGGRDTEPRDDREGEWIVGPGHAAAAIAALVALIGFALWLGRPGGAETTSAAPSSARPAPSHPGPALGSAPAESAHAAAPNASIPIAGQPCNPDVDGNAVAGDGTPLACRSAGGHIATWIPMQPSGGSPKPDAGQSAAGPAAPGPAAPGNSGNSDSADDKPSNGKPGHGNRFKPGK
ncbi:serine/threonine-protein kinase [Nocardia sp. CA-129566]|uniref:serine/threonine-protein kinase n=1 Tax=Nocardia sp. CA-129566 TaxID=3239976 RepID=UPI003D981D6F